MEAKVSGAAAATRRAGGAGLRRRAQRGEAQSAAAVRATVAPGRTAELARLLSRFSTDAAGAPGIAFARLSGVHFARFVLLEQVPDLQGRTIAASVLYLGEIDGPVDRHLRELAELAADGIDAAFGHCAGYPAAPSLQSRVAFLREHAIETQAPYFNTVGRTVDQVRREAVLRDAIADFLDAQDASWRPADPAAVRRAVQTFVHGEPELEWARRRAPRPPLRWRVAEKLHALGVPLALLLAAPLLAAVAPVWALLLRLHERADPAPHVRPSPDHLGELLALEDFGAQNQFAAIGLVKPGPFRRLTIRVLLWLTAFATRHVFNRANLAGVKTIHFARWLVLDDYRRVIFTSNYDGSVESYMDDFIDKVAWGLNALFSNGVGYPKTRWLVLDGAHDEQTFKDLLRHRQIPSQVWYSAYDQLSARNVRNNELIRSGLFGPMSRFETAAWVARL